MLPLLHFSHSHGGAYMDTRPKMFNLSQTRLLFVSFLVCMITFPARESSAQAAAPALSPAGQAALNELQKSNQAGDIWGRFYLAMAYMGPNKGGYGPATIPVRALPMEAAYVQALETDSGKTDFPAAAALFLQNMNAGHVPSIAMLWHSTCRPKWRSQAARSARLRQFPGKESNGCGKPRTKVMTLVSDSMVKLSPRRRPRATRGRFARSVSESSPARNRDAIVTLAKSSLPNDQKTLYCNQCRKRPACRILRNVETRGDYSRGEYVAKGLTAALQVVHVAAATGMPRARMPLNSS